MSLGQEIFMVIVWETFAFCVLAAAVLGWQGSWRETWGVWAALHVVVAVVVFGGRFFIYHFWPWLGTIG